MTVMPVYVLPTEYKVLVEDLMHASIIHTGEWQSMNTAGSPLHATREMEDVTLIVPAVDRRSLVADLMPDEPWADEHFAERVSGFPHNPPPSAVRWPYAVRNHADHTDAAGTFDHTYPERFWPTHAGDCHSSYAWAGDGGIQAVDRHGVGDVDPDICGGRSGIRFQYGDLNDVVSLLVRNPLTRQAYLPIWFPEDTGASAHKGPHEPGRDGDLSSIRVPCTLGYHFMIRNNVLSCRYYLRSCDVYRHMNNDLYFAARLMEWMCDRINARAEHDPREQLWTPAIKPGRLMVHIASLHMFVADAHKMRQRMELHD